MFAGSIVDTLQTLSGGPVAVADSVRVHVAVALAELALFRGAELTGRVAEVTVGTHLAFWSCKSIMVNITEKRYFWFWVPKDLV